MIVQYRIIIVIEWTRVQLDGLCRGRALLHAHVFYLIEGAGQAGQGPAVYSPLLRGQVGRLFGFVSQGAQCTNTTHHSVCLLGPLSHPTLYHSIILQPSQTLILPRNQSSYMINPTYHSVKAVPVTTSRQRTYIPPSHYK